MLNKRLIDCKKTCRVVVLKLNADTELKQRFISFGIMKGVEVEVLEYAPAKSTMEIKIGKTKIAIRAQEAELIEVRKI